MYALKEAQASKPIFPNERTELASSSYSHGLYVENFTLKRRFS
jgi:hypothetical protein